MKHIIDWVINHRKNRVIRKFCHIISLKYPFFLHFYFQCGRKKFESNPKKAAFTLSFDCDYEKDLEALPVLLNLLKKYKTKATFACIGLWIEKYPEVHKDILKNGHEILNHSYSHPDNEELNPNKKFNEISPDERKEEIERCHLACKNILNYEPTGFRVPHFARLFTRDIYRILRDLNYAYSSSTRAIGTSENGQPFLTEEAIVEFPLSPCPAHPFVIFDSLHTTSERVTGAQHKNCDNFYKWFTRLINVAIRTDSYINVYFDPQDIVKVSSFEKVLEYIRKRENEIQVTTYRQIIESQSEQKDQFSWR